MSPGFSRSSALISCAPSMKSSKPWRASSGMSSGVPVSASSSAQSWMSSTASSAEGVSTDEGSLRSTPSSRSSK